MLSSLICYVSNVVKALSLSPIYFPLYRIIALSFTGAIGVLFVVLGCALKDYG